VITVTGKKLYEKILKKNNQNANETYTQKNNLEKINNKRFLKVNVENPVAESFEWLTKVAKVAT
jgi:hypothetical protein